MYYEINVAKQEFIGTSSRFTYKHFFATAKRSITTESELKNVLKCLVVAFPKPEYDITVTRYETSGLFIDIQRVLKEE